MFLAPEDVVLTRLNVAVASVTTSGLRMHIPFQSNKSREELEMEILNVTCNDSQKTISRPQLQTVVDFAEDEFSHIHVVDKSRDNAIPVIILVVKDYPGKVQDLQLFLNGHYKISRARIFVALVGNRIGDMKQRVTSNSVSIGSFAELLNNHIFVMAICKKCHPSWFMEEYSDSQFGLSCYKLLEFTFYESWQNASIECEKQGAQLVSIETDEEYMRLHNTVKEALKTKSEPSAYIGLTRKGTNQVQRFRWVNHRPLLLHHWQPPEPQGGSLQKCVVWAIDECKSGSNSLTWMAVGCGKAYTPIALCEVYQSFPRKASRSSFTITATNTASYNQILQTDDFLSIQGKIISVPANIKDQSVLMMLQSKVPGKVFRCENDVSNSDIVPYSSLCDFIRDCKNGNDELICRYRRCDPATEFTCLSKQCVPLESRCDLYKDCLDGSDEAGCTECKGQRCCDGTCLPRHWFGDGEVDCAPCHQVYDSCPSTDTFYDEDLSSHQKDDCSFICNLKECIFLSQLNDSVVDCEGLEGILNETTGKLETASACKYSNGKYYWSSRCMYIKDRYGSVMGCRNISYLLDCTNFQCPEGYIKCPQSYCIALHSLYDGIMDCPFGEDEQYVDDHNCTGNFDCWNSEVCVHPDLVCDGHPHCPSGDDELACNTSCSDGFLCIAGMVTVADYDKSKPLHSLVFIDKRTRYLDLSGVDLSAPLLKEDRGHFINLIYLRLSGCQLDSVTGSFALEVQELETVYWMDLSHNFIKEITRDSMFTYMTNLHELDLSHNRLLTFIDSDGLSPAFGTSSLAKLDLSYTGLTYIETGVLQQLTNLQSLNLSHMRLSNLSSSAFPEDFTLKTLDIRGSALHNTNPDFLTGLTISHDLYTDHYHLCCPQLRGPGIPDHTCHAPRVAILSCSDLIGDDMQRIFLWLTGIVAVVGNLVVLIFRLVFYKDTMEKATGIFVTHLELSDIIMGTYLLIIAGMDVHYRGIYVWNSEVWRQSILCKIEGFLSTLSSETSMFFIFLITLDRYLVIKFPSGQYMFSKYGVAISAALAWVIGFLLAFLPVSSVFDNWTIYSSNGLCLSLPLSNGRFPGWEYSVAVFIILNFVMFLFIGFGQLLIYKAMSENKAEDNSARSAQDIAVAKQLAPVVLTNFICWFIIGFMGFLALSGHDINTEAYGWSHILIFPVNSALNPLLYTTPILLEKWEQFKSGNPTTIT